MEAQSGFKWNNGRQEAKPTETRKGRLILKKSKNQDMKHEKIQITKLNTENRIIT